jgi:hypothetical protein
MLQIIGEEACCTARRLIYALMAIFSVQLLSFYFAPPEQHEGSHMNLMILLFQFSLFLVGFFGARRFRICLLRLYVGIRVTMWVLNFVLLFVYILFPEFCLHFLLPFVTGRPTEVLAAHINHFVTLSDTMLFIIYQIASFLYTCLVVYSVLLAYKLAVFIMAARDILPLEVAAATAAALAPQPAAMTPAGKVAADATECQYAPVATVDLEAYAQPYAAAAETAAPAPNAEYPEYAMYPDALYPTLHAAE